MPDPAASFANFDPSRNSRLAQTAAMQSGLYVAHKDWTKPLARPNTIQEIIDGNETNAQYCVRLGIPAGATNVSLHWLTQLELSVSTASLNSISCNLAGTSLSYFLRVFGRIPTLKSPYSYGPADAGLSGAVAINASYGLWRPLWQYNLNVGGANEIVALNSTVNGGLQYEVSSTVRLLASPLIVGGSGYIINTASSPMNNRAVAQVSNGDTGSVSWHDPMHNTIPLRGCTQLLVVPEISNTFTSATFSTSVSGGTATVSWSAIGATFHS